VLRDAGFVAYLLKPILFDRLLDTVEAVKIFVGGLPQVVQTRIPGPPGGLITGRRNAGHPGPL